MSFGSKFGLLVRQRRTAKGLSPADLARLVFGRGDLEYRIINIEKGEIDRSHERIVAALSSALSIDDKQIEDCKRNKPALAELPPRVNESLRTGFQLLHKNATPEEVALFIRSKHTDFLAIRKSIAITIRNGSGAREFAERLNALISSTAFDSCDLELEVRENACKSIASRVAIRRLRADIALFSCDARFSAEHFQAAADILNPIVPDAAADLRNQAATKLFRHTHKLGTDHRLPAQMLQQNLQYWRREAYPEKWAMTQINLSNALYLHAGVLTGKNMQLKLEEAISGYRQGLEIYSETQHRQERLLAQSNFAAALTALARLKGGSEKVELLEEASQAFRATVGETSQRAKPGTWAGYQSKLANTLGEQARVSSGNRSAELLKQAQEASTKSLKVYTPEKSPVHWITAQNSIANALRGQAAKSPKPEAVSLLTEAIKTYRKALDACDLQKQSTQWAWLQNNLALALMDQAALGNRVSSSVLLDQAIKACQAALTQRSPARSPNEWAASKTLLGEAHFASANRVRGDDAIKHIKAAIDAFTTVVEADGVNSSPARALAATMRLVQALERHGDLTAEDKSLHYKAASSALDDAIRIAKKAQMTERLYSLRDHRTQLAKKVQYSQQQERRIDA